MQKIGAGVSGPKKREAYVFQALGGRGAVVGPEHPVGRVRQSVLRDQVSVETDLVYVDSHTGKGGDGQVQDGLDGGPHGRGFFNELFIGHGLLLRPGKGKRPHRLGVFPDGGKIGPGLVKLSGRRYVEELSDLYRRFSAGVTLLLEGGEGYG